MHREIGCDNEITDSDSLQEKDGARKTSKSPDRSSDIAHEEQLLRHHTDAQRNLSAEAPMLASQTSAQSKSKKMSSTESRWRSSRFKMRRRLKLKEILKFKKWKKSEDMKTHQVPWSISSRADCRISIWSPHPKIPFVRQSNMKRHRPQNQELFLSLEARRRDLQHQQRCRGKLTKLLNKGRKKLGLYP